MRFEPTVRITLMGFAVLGMFLTGAALVYADTGDVTGKVYLGDKSNYSNPACVKIKDIYAVIPEYQEIEERGLTKDDAEYWPLIRKASSRFLEALGKVAEAAEPDYDLVGEVGFIEGKTPPDITDDVIEQVKKGLEDENSEE